MPKTKLTKPLIDGLSPGEQDQIYWDSEQPRLHLKVTPAGKKVFFLYYRVLGAAKQQRRYKIGDYGAITLHQARERAKSLLGMIADGKDPAADRKQARRRFNSELVADLVAEFFSKHVAQNRSAAETERIFNTDIVPRLGNRSIHSLKKHDVIAVLEAIADRDAPIMANRTLAALRKFLNWCVARGIIDKSPADGAEAPGKETKRDRVLTDDELRRVLVAARQIGFPYGLIVELLTITGQRREEVAGMSWSELDLAARTWTIPAARSKNNKPHIIHLSDVAMAVFDRVPRIETQSADGPHDPADAEPLVFSTNGKTPFQGFSNAKRQLDDLSGVTGWTLHDLRRTLVSGMARLGVPPHIADKVLNHQTGTISGVAAVYQRHEFLNERKSALDQWGSHVTRLLHAASSIPADD
jgi:integrase